jgi:CyaY protein
VDRKTFVHASGSALERLDEVLGNLEHDSLDVDLAGDVLTLGFDDGVEYIINAHSAASQIWMAAGTHAWHFDLVGDGEQARWIASKTGDELMETVARQVGAKLGQSVEL